MSVSSGLTVGSRTAPPQLIHCMEYEPVCVPVRDLLGPDGHLALNPEIEKGDYFSASLRQGVLTLRAGGYVGYVPLTDQVIVRIKPRVPVENLTQLVEISGLPKTSLSCVRDYELSGTWSSSFADLYAAALAGHIENIMVNGLLRDYRRIEEASSFPRGRILMSPTFQSCVARGELHRAVSTWFIRTIDNSSNRCLKYAMWLMGQHYARSASLNRESRLIQRRLNAAYYAFDGVFLDHTHRFIYDSLVSGQRNLPTHRAYYRDALDVGLAIVRQRGLLVEEALRGDIRLPSLVLSMADLFESYARRVLQLYATTNGWSWQVLDGNSEGSRPLYRGQTAVAATPDIVIRDTQGSQPLILEVKYIPVIDNSPREAVNQAITYAACYETSRVVLVHPCGSNQTPGMRRIGDVGRTEVFQYRYDLAALSLDAEADRFGKAVGELLVITP